MTIRWPSTASRARSRSTARDLLAVLAMAGIAVAGGEEAIALKLAGAFRRNGDRWDARRRQGKAHRRRLHGHVRADRGAARPAGRARHHDALRAPRSQGCERAPRPRRRRRAHRPRLRRSGGTHVDLRLEAATLVVRNGELADAAIIGRAASDGVRLDRLGFAFAAGPSRRRARCARFRKAATSRRSSISRSSMPDRSPASPAIGGGQVAGKISGRAAFEARAGRSMRRPRSAAATRCWR